MKDRNRMIPYQWYCEKCGRPSFVGEIYARNLEGMGNFLASNFKGLCEACEKDTDKDTDKA